MTAAPLSTTAPLIFAQNLSLQPLKAMFSWLKTPHRFIQIKCSEENSFPKTEVIHQSCVKLQLSALLLNTYDQLVLLRFKPSVYTSRIRRIRSFQPLGPGSVFTIAITTMCQFRYVFFFFISDDRVLQINCEISLNFKNQHLDHFIPTM